MLVYHIASNKATLHFLSFMQCNIQLNMSKDSHSNTENHSEMQLQIQVTLQTMILNRKMPGNVLDLDTDTTAV